MGWLFAGLDSLMGFVVERCTSCSLYTICLRHVSLDI